MDPSELGKRIKEARIARKMTQSEVVGDYITRNMLSQIESGTATPSVKTLTYIAKALELPLNYFLAEDVPDSMSRGGSPSGEAPVQAVQTVQDTVSEKLAAMKNAFKGGDYERAAQYALPFSQTDESVLYDEACVILAMSYLVLARKKNTENDLRGAASYARNAEKYSSLGIYSKREIRTEALLLLDEIAEKMA